MGGLIRRHFEPQRSGPELPAGDMKITRFPNGELLNLPGLTGHLEIDQIYSEDAVTLCSSDPNDPPVIESRLLSDRRDLDRMLWGMDHALAAFGAMAEGLDAELLIPGHSLRPRKAPRAHPAAAFDRVSPERHLRHRSRGRRALPAQRGARAMAGRRVGHAGGGARQHELAEAHDRREGRGLPQFRNLRSARSLLGQTACPDRLWV